MDIVDAQTIWQCGMNNVSVSTDGGKTWKAVADKAGGQGCVLSFANADTGWFGFGTKFEATKDGGATWEALVLPAGASKIAAISLRTPMDGYLVDANGVLYITKDGGKTWSSQSLGLENPDIQGFVSQGFVNEIPQAAIRFVDSGHGLIVLGLSGKDGMIALRTADGGKTWKEESLPAKFGAAYISRDGKFVTVNKWGEGVTLLKYE
jgi:photosystem II stability/assembly factor-like uncharacterized protein